MILFGNIALCAFHSWLVSDDDQLTGRCCQASNSHSQ